MLSASETTSDALALDGKNMSQTLKTSFVNTKARASGPTQGSSNSPEENESFKRLLHSLGLSDDFLKALRERYPNCSKYLEDSAR